MKAKGAPKPLAAAPALPASPAPSASGGNSHGQLLSEIATGVKLKSVAPEASSKAAAPTNPLQSGLANAIEQRRAAMQEDDDADTDKDEDDADWV
jgi:hypothetical protein